MTRFVSIHSFRRGTGKSNIITNLAVLLAAGGRRTGLVDTDLLSPTVHIPLGVSEDGMDHTLNDYLHGRCGITQAVYQARFSPAENSAGPLYVVPANSGISPIARILGREYAPDLLSNGFHQLAEALRLDVLLIDTHSGLNEESLTAMAMADIALITLRPDQQDYQGTGIIIDIAHRLKAPQTILIVNEVPPRFDVASVKAEVERVYQREVATVLPHLEEMPTLGSKELFALRYPTHPVTAALRQVAARLAGPA